MAIDPKDQQEINKLYEEYIRLLQIADNLTEQQAKAQADVAKNAGNLTNEINRLNTQLNNAVFRSDSLAGAFRDILSSLKSQNLALQSGKTIFKQLEDTASSLTYYQRGIVDLTEKDFKKKIEVIGKNELELNFVKDRLSTEKGAYVQENLLQTLRRIGVENLTKSQKQLLSQLEKEKALLEDVKGTLEDGLPVLQQEYNISKQIFNVRRDLGGLATAAAKVVSEYGGSLAKFLNIDEATESVNKYNKELIDGALKSKEVLREINNIENERIKTIQNSASVQKAIEADIKSIQNDINAALLAQTKLESLNNQLLQKQNEFKQASLQEKNKIQGEINDLLQQINDTQIKSNQLDDLKNKQLEKQNNLITEQINEKKNLAALDKKENDVKQTAIASVSTLNNKFKSLGILVSGLGAGLKKAFTDPLTIITFFVDKALEANKQAIEVGKSLGYGVDRANAFRENIAAIARESSNINVTAASLTKAFSELVQATGFAYEFTADQLTTQVKLTEQVGLQANEAAQIQRIAVLNNKTSEETYKSYVRGLTAARNQFKVGIDFKAALAEALNVSGQLAANLGYNPERIAKAVVQAKALGMTLDQVAKSGESLLNFESSIENELKAELLTGRQLNLERARAAALAGDQITLAEELAKNIGTSADFTKMNVLQQKALAESVGMTADELANTLRKREEAIASGKSLAQVTAEEVQQALERQAIQDKFNKAILKLQDFIGNLLAGPVGELLDAFTNILGVVFKVLGVLNPVFNFISSIAKHTADILSSTIGLTAAFSLLALSYGPKLVASVKGWWMGIKGSISSLFASTAATNADTLATTANTTATRLNATQLKSYQALRAAGIPASQAFAAAKTIETNATAANTLATGANTTATGTNTVATNTSILASIRSRLAILAHNIATATSTALQYAWNTVKGLSIAIMNSSIITWIAEKATIIGHTIATQASAAAQGVWNFVKGAGNLLMKTALGQWIAEKVAIVASTIAKWANVGANTAVATSSAAAATSTATLGTASTTASGGIVGLGAALGAFGIAAAPAIPVILSLGAALLMATPAIYVLGEVIKSIATTIGNVLMKALEMLPAIIDSVAKGFVTIFSTLAENWKILIPVGIGLMSIAGGMTLLGVASLTAFPGLLLGSVGLGALAASITVLSFAVSEKSIEKIGNLFEKLNLLNATKLLAVGPALIGIGVGLAALGGGGVIGAIGGAISKLFGGGGPIETLTKLASLGESLQLTANSLKLIKESFTQLSTLELNDSIINQINKLSASIKGLAPAAIPIAILTSFLTPFILTLKIAAPAIEIFGNTVKTIFDSLTTTINAASTGISQIFTAFSNVDVSKLLTIGPALAGIGIGLASLGTGGVINAIGAFLSGDPVKKLERLSTTGDGLQKVALALQSISTSLTSVSSALSAIDTTKLEKLDTFASNRANESTIGGITEFITAPIKAIGEVITGGNEKESTINTGIDLTPMIAAINEVKTAVNQLENKNGAVYLDGKEVGSWLWNASRKVS